MKMPAIVTDRKAREEFKDKIDVVIAVVVLVGFAHKKFNQSRHGMDETDQQENKE